MSPIENLAQNSYPQFSEANKLITKAAVIGLRYFPLGCSLCLVGWGAKELFLDTYGTPKKVEFQPSQSLFQKVTNALNWFFENIRIYASEEERKRQVLHGILFLGSGITGVLSQFNPLMQTVSNGMFVMGNMVFLELNIRKYYTAQEIIKKGVMEEQEYAHSLLHSAYLGMINNLGYLACAAFIALGQSAGLVFLLGGLGCIFGCIKILYDLLNWQNLNRPLQIS